MYICSACLLNISDNIIILFAIVFKDSLMMPFFDTKIVFSLGNGSATSAHGNDG